jgi:hypothetical protein
MVSGLNAYFSGGGLKLTVYGYCPTLALADKTTVKSLFSSIE